MKFSRFVSFAALFALASVLVACSGSGSKSLPSPARTQTSAVPATATPARSPLPVPTFDPGVPLVPVPAAPSPPSPSPPDASPTPAATETPRASFPGRPANQITITRLDDRKTVEAFVGDLIQVQLGTDFRWQVQPPDPSLLMPVSAGLPAGVQALYVAKEPGSVEFAATGTANCPPGVACPLFAILFKVELVIH